MLLDDLGKRLQTNKTTSDDGVFTKRFRAFSPTMAWGFYERKPYQSKVERYARERDALRKLSYMVPNVPELIGADDDRLALTLRKVELSDLSRHLRPDVPYDKRIGRIVDALTLLKEVHAAGVAHGDPYIKNWGVLPSGKPFLCDFEYRREADGREQEYDVLLFAADAIATMPEHEREICYAVKGAYGPVSFAPDDRDLLFFRIRFGREDRFFRALSE